MEELSLEALMDAPVHLPVRRVAVPELDGFCYIRSITGQEREDFEMSFVHTKGKQTSVHMTNYKAKLVVLCLCSADGRPLAPSPLTNEPAIKKMAGQSAKVLERLFDEAAELNGLSDSDVEALEGNLLSDPSEGISSKSLSVVDTQRSG